MLYEVITEFDHANLELGINEAHSLGKKLYVVANIQPHNSKLKTFVRDMKPVVDMKPDALIMSDPGLIMMVREHFPEMPIHFRITSYNVCYTKLLRFVALITALVHATVFSPEKVVHLAALIVHAANEPARRELTITGGYHIRTYPAAVVVASLFLIRLVADFVAAPDNAVDYQP